MLKLTRGTRLINNALGRLQTRNFYRAPKICEHECLANLTRPDWLKN